MNRSINSVDVSVFRSFALTVQSDTIEQTRLAVSGVPRTGVRGVTGLEPPPLMWQNFSISVPKMRQNTVFSTKNAKKNFWGGAQPPPHNSPPRRLRRLDPLHAEILGTPLLAVYVKNEDVKNEENRRPKMN